MKTSFYKMYGGTRAYITAHPVISIIAAIVIVGVGYWAYGKLTSTAGETQYVLGIAERQTLILSVSGTGQVSSYNQVDIKPKASGDITWVAVKAGDTVRAGQALGQIDNTNAKQAVADAEQSLAQARLQFQKDTAQAPIDYQKSLETLDSAKTDLSNTYNDTFNTLSTAYLDLPVAVTGMQNILYGYDLSQNKSQWNLDILRNTASESNTTVRPFADIAERDYKTARAKYDSAVLDYKTLTRYSDSASLEKQLASSVDTTTAIAQALQSELNLLDAVTDDAASNGRTVSSAVNTMRTNTRGYLATANSNLSALLNQQKSLDTAKKTIRDDERNIEIYKIGNPGGDNPISLQSSQYSIADQERKLQQLKDDLANYVIMAPFDGTVAVLNLKKFDTVSTANSVASIITKQQIAELSLNEVDAAKVKAGQKTTLTFDAVEDLSISGEVASVDTVGTVSQGVVTYVVKIAFDTQDNRVKSGMSVTAAIVTDLVQNVITLPQSAVKTVGDSSYVQIFTPPLTNTSGAQAVPSATPPKQVPVQTGLSNDTDVEITQGVKEGDQIVVRTITGTSAATTQAPSLLNAVGGRGGGSGNVRIGG